MFECWCGWLCRKLQRTHTGRVFLHCSWVVCPSAIQILTNALPESTPWMHSKVFTCCVRYCNAGGRRCMDRFLISFICLFVHALKERRLELLTLIFNHKWATVILRHPYTHKNSSSEVSRLRRQSGNNQYSLINIKIGHTDKLMLPVVLPSFTISTVGNTVSVSAQVTSWSTSTASSALSITRSTYIRSTFGCLSSTRLPGSSQEVTVDSCWTSTTLQSTPRLTWFSPALCHTKAAAGKRPSYIIIIIIII